jgi:nucleoside-diphosphate-sugar epimerase
MRQRPRFYPALPRRFRARPVLLVGCGDVGTRIARHLLAQGLRVIGTVRSADKAQALRAIGVAVLRVDLDTRDTRRLGGLADRLIHLAPPPAEGSGDPRLGRLLAAIGAAHAARPTTRRSGLVAPPRQPRRPRWVYISTTGVYGDAAGAVFDETRPVAPGTARAIRRVAAERLWRASTRGRLAPIASVLRVPGIYAHDRLPLDRLRAGTPALADDEDVHTNHIHADDLARIALAALWRGRCARVVHAVDDTEWKMGQYFDAVADAAGLPRPPRLPRDELARRVSPALLSFMSESRRLANRRLKRELRVRLGYPTVADALADRFDRPSAGPLDCAQRNRL